MIRNRYNLLLALLVLHLTGLALDLPRPWNDLVNIAAAPIAAYLLRSITRRRRDLWVMLALGLSGSLLNLAFAWGSVPLALDLVKMVLWTLAPAYLALRVFAVIYDTDSITHAEIAGAIAVYLMVALVFANVYEALYHIDPRHISFGENFAASGVGFGEILYFSFVTMSTLGYGDVAPASTLARVVTVVESVTGLMYMAILVARFVSLHSAHRFERRRRELPPE